VVQRRRRPSTEAALAAIARVDPALNSFTEVTAERARTQARAVDARRAAGAPLPPLAGVPYAVKNLFDIEGLTTLAGAKVNATNPPATADAALVARMRNAGAILVGALNMDEFAYGFTTENTHFGVTRNPHDTTRVAGGSSGAPARRWRRGSCRSRWARTPTARSACRRRCAACGA
jgi:Asp-tRNA(Asn)/Glu-tRNA(Gln) amidotransferase A subunit family amidase